jgi:hypothetical protein
LALAPAAATEIVNAGSETTVVPSVAEISTALNVPTLLAVGVPDSKPVDASNDVQDGLFAIVKVTAPWLGTAACGLKLYGWPTVAVTTGMPWIVGPVLVEGELAGEALVPAGVLALAVELPDPPPQADRALPIIEMQTKCDPSPRLALFMRPPNRRPRWFIRQKRPHGPC